jgi:hypothetical protein
MIEIESKIVWVAIGGISFVRHPEFGASVGQDIHITNCNNGRGGTKID